MLGVAAVGLVVNFAGMRLLQKGSTESLNLKGAYFEVLSDMLSSIGVIVAGVIMWATEWYYGIPSFQRPSVYSSCREHGRYCAKPSAYCWKARRLTSMSGAFAPRSLKCPVWSQSTISMSGA